MHVDYIKDKEELTSKNTELIEKYELLKYEYELYKMNNTESESGSIHLEKYQEQLNQNKILLDDLNEKNKVIINLVTGIFLSFKNIFYSS